LHDCQAIGADLSNAVLHKVHGDRAVFQGAVLHRAQLQGADFSEADFKQADLGRAATEEATFYRARLVGASLVHADLQGTSFIEADVSYADFHHASMQESDFTRSLALSCSFDWALLQGSQFKGADIRGSNLNGCNIGSCDFKACCLVDEELKRAVDVDLAQLQDRISEPHYCGHCGKHLEVWGTKSMALKHWNEKHPALPPCAVPISIEEGCRHIVVATNIGQAEWSRAWPVDGDNGLTRKEKASSPIGTEPSVAMVSDTSLRVAAAPAPLPEISTTTRRHFMDLPLLSTSTVACR